MRTLKSALIPTLLVLLAASMVTVMWWEVSKSPLADGPRKTSGRVTAATTSDITTTLSTVAQLSPQESIRAVASFVKVTLLAFLKVTVLMGLPGVFTVVVVNRMKRHRRQSDGA
jgi:ABC-type Co2+ transport system permease subunit